MVAWGDDGTGSALVVDDGGGKELGDFGIVVDHQR